MGCGEMDNTGFGLGQSVVTLLASLISAGIGHWFSPHLPWVCRTIVLGHSILRHSNIYSLPNTANIDDPSASIFTVPKPNGIRPVHD